MQDIREPVVLTARPDAPAPGRAGRARRRRQQLLAWAFLVPLVAYLVLCYGYPLATNIDLSLRGYTVRTFVHGGAPLVWFDNYVTVFGDPTFRTALLDTFVFTAASLLFQYGIGLAMAVFFARNFRLGPTLRALFLVPWLLPLIVSGSTWAWLLNSESGVVNSVLGWFGAGKIDWLTSPSWSLVSVIIANIWIGVPFNLVLLYSGLQAIPQELYEAAALDGAGWWRRFRAITVPQIRPEVFVVVITATVGALKVFAPVLILTGGGPEGSTVVPSYYSYRNFFELSKVGYGSAIATAMSIVIFLVAGVMLWLQRRGAREEAAG